MKQEIDVLLVDDDNDICVMIEAILTFSGYKVLSCSVPEQLPSILNENSPRLILMDMLLSGTDGRILCTTFKASEDHTPVKIVMMSAHPDADKSCRAAGADDFIAKPFDMDHFTDIIRQQLGNAVQ